MNVTRIFTDTGGGSHFELVPILMEDQSDMGYFSTPITNMKSMRFQKVFSRGEWDFHAAGGKSYVVLMEGVLEIEVSDGERLRFTAGDVILFDDVSGQGHKSKTFENSACGMVISLG
ncbi:MAG: hypothetical protein QNK23_01565 [Crocinitomicaceae bacterium]|nr:hypothetical protein [Crocinitomicaceae bacterium]